MNKNLMFSLLIFCLASVPLFNVSAAIDPTYKVGTWANFCKCAVTHGFDDNMNLSGEGQTIFDQRGFHMTLHVRADSTDWPKCKASFAKGHEIASHASTDADCYESWALITANVSGEKCISISYPDSIISSAAFFLRKYYIAGRICDGKINDKTPSNWYQISSKMFEFPYDSASLNNFAIDAAAKNGWAVYCHHGIGTERNNWSVTNLNAIEKHLDYLNKNRDKYWVETFGNVARYIKERNAVSIKQLDSTRVSIKVEVTDTLDNKIYNYPLTIRRLLPHGWQGNVAYVLQNQKPAKDTIIIEGTDTIIMFEAVPDGGDVFIVNGDIVGAVPHGSTISGESIMSVRGKNLLINRGRFLNNTFSVSYFDLKGKVLAMYNIHSNESQIVVPTEKISRSAFIVRINDGGRMYTQSFIPEL
jgi:oligosaccharide reducing-end xylanase